MFALGVDYGTNSDRALVVRCKDEMCSAEASWSIQEEAEACVPIRSTTSSGARRNLLTFSAEHSAAFNVQPAGRALVG